MAADYIRVKTELEDLRQIKQELQHKLSQTMACDAAKIEKDGDSDEYMPFSFHQTLQVKKMKLAAVSPVFTAQIKHREEENDHAAVNIVDCSYKTFSRFLIIIEDGAIFKKHRELENLDLTELMEMFNLINKYQTGLIDEVFTNQIHLNNLGVMMNFAEKYKAMTIFEGIYEKMVRRCACFILNLEHKGDIMKMLSGNTSQALFQITANMDILYEDGKLCKNCAEWKTNCKHGIIVDTLRKDLKVYGDGYVVLD